MKRYPLYVENVHNMTMSNDGTVVDEKNECRPSKIIQPIVVAELRGCILGWLLILKLEKRTFL